MKNLQASSVYQLQPSWWRVAINFCTIALAFHLVGVLCSALEFTATVSGQAVKTLQFSGGVRHTITMNVSGTVRLQPYQTTCDETRFLSEIGNLDATLRVWGTAREEGTTEPEDFDFDVPRTIVRHPSSTDSRFTPQTGSYLYLITRDSVPTPPTTITVYAFEYISSLQVMRIWISLIDPFYYDAEFEHYDFPATHVVSGASTAPSCLRGVVLAPGSGQPLSGAQVRFGGVARTTDSSGSFQYDGIPPNSYLLTIDKPSYRQFRSVETIPAFSIVSRPYTMPCCPADEAQKANIEFPTMFWPRTEFQQRLTRISAESGERLEVWWARDPGSALQYQLRYYAPGVGQELIDGIKIGACLFQRGVNAANYVYSDSNKNSIPDCFLKVTWKNFDFYEDDHRGGLWDGLLDVFLFDYFVCENRRCVRHHAYEYGCGGPPISRLPNFTEPICEQWLGSLVHETVVCDSGEGTGSVGAASSGVDGLIDFFSASLAASGIPETEIEMGAVLVDLSDLDFNGTIDFRDYQSATNALGTCAGTAGYFPILDANADGCISGSDLRILFPGDSDGDGMADWQEWVAGTNPFSAESLLRLSAVQHQAGTAATLQWPGVSGRTYAVLRASALPWANGVTLRSNILATPPLNRFTDTTVTNNQSYFYRIEVR